MRVRITSVRSGPGDGEPIRAFVQRMFEGADAAGARRLVLDLRSVSGSDTFLLVPLLKGVIARDHFRGPGGVVVVVGAQSFSPIQNTATLLEQYAKPVFVY
jgi:anti-anti-sigma regulatory factor